MTGYCLRCGFQPRGSKLATSLCSYCEDGEAIGVEAERDDLSRRHGPEVSSDRARDEVEEREVF